MLSEELELTLNNAFKDAKEKRYKFVTTEHLLLALLENPTATQLLRACGGKLELLREELVEFIDENTPLFEDSTTAESEPKPEFTRVLQRAVLHVQSSGGNEVFGDNVLIALFGEKDSYAVHLLNKQNLMRLDVIKTYSAPNEPNAFTEP